MTLEELSLTQQEAQQVLEVIDATGMTVDQLIAEEVSRLRDECRANQGLKP